MRWFKMDVGLPTDSKVITLPSDSHRWLWACVLCSAGKERKGGYVGPSYDAKYLSRITDFSEGEIPEALAMFAAGEEPLIEFSKGGIQILNWKKWQSDAEYMAKYREGKGENLQSKSKNLTELPEDKIRGDKIRLDKKPPIAEKYSAWLTAWNEKGPGPTHAKLGEKAGEYLDLLTTEGAADGEVWTLDKFTAAVEIYAELLKAGRWKYKWPSLTDVLSRTLNQVTGPGLTHFLPREGYDPRKELGLRERPKGAGSHRAVECEGEYSGCPDIELEQGYCTKHKTCPNFKEHK